MQIYKVGGAVRDRLLGKPVADTDWVVVGATGDEMLVKGYRPVGMDFPVFLHPLTGEEYALARTERKVGRGYGGFVFHASPEVTLEEDLIRRDLTINAMAEDGHGHIIDPYHGRRDLEARILRHVSSAFAEDPLRVLRVARFAARYAPEGFSIAEETLQLMRELSESGELLALTPERSWKEISRALMEREPQVFFQVLRDCHALKVLFPEVDSLFETFDEQGSSLGDRALAALHQAACHEQPLAVRWACVLHAVALAPEDAAAEQRKLALKQLKTIGVRFKAPKECQELAQLLGQYLSSAQHALQLEAPAVLELLQSFDVYRRPQRFDAFLKACEMIAVARGSSSGATQTAYLLGAAETARHVEAQPLIEQGLAGQALGEALKRARLDAVRLYRSNHSRN